MLAGIGNSPVSEMTTPMLTTMNYQYEESGRRAASLLLNRIKTEGEKEAYAEVLLGYSLIVRESTED